MKCLRGDPLCIGLGFGALFSGAFPLGPFFHCTRLEDPKFPDSPTPDPVGGLLSLAAPPPPVTIPEFPLLPFPDEGDEVHRW